MQVERIDWRR